VIKVFDARLANQPFLVFEFWALWRSTVIARVPENSKTKNGRLASLASILGTNQPSGVQSLNYSCYFGNTELNWLIGLI